jgi:hypothetical protein
LAPAAIGRRSNSSFIAANRIFSAMSLEFSAALHLGIELVAQAIAHQVERKHGDQDREAGRRAVRTPARRRAWCPIPVSGAARRRPRKPSPAASRMAFDCVTASRVAGAGRLRLERECRARPGPARHPAPSARRTRSSQERRMFVAANDAGEGWRYGRERALTRRRQAFSPSGAKRAPAGGAIFKTARDFNGSFSCWVECSVIRVAAGRQTGPPRRRVRVRIRRGPVLGA